MSHVNIKNFSVNYNYFYFYNFIYWTTMKKSFRVAVSKNSEKLLKNKNKIK